MIELRSVNNIFKKFFDFKNRNNQQKLTEQTDLRYHHSELDPKNNAETCPPREEKIRIPALWAFEAFTPSYIMNFHNAVRKLGWSQEDWSLRQNVEDTLNEYRYKMSGGGWINLGHIVDEKNKAWWPNIKKASLPEGVESIKASLIPFLPSTTIFVCMFKLEEELARSIEVPLRNAYSTFTKKTNTGYSMIDVLHQKKDGVINARNSLKKLCTSWLNSNFPGIFASKYHEGNYPLCELITFDKYIPFQKINEQQSYKSFLSMLDLGNNYSAWKSDELDGLFLQLTEGEKNINNLVLFGNINDMLSSKDLEGYGENNKERKLNYLNYLDRSLGIWVLYVLIKSFERRITKLRDSYGEYDIISNRKNNASILMSFDKQILDIQKNAIPFIHELKDFCNKEKYFMLDVFEYKAMHEARKTEDGLFNSIRKRLLFYSELLNKNEQLLRSTADANRQIVTAISSNYLAQTNINLQKQMNRMTWFILILTIVLVLLTIALVFSAIDLSKMIEWLDRLI